MPKYDIEAIASLALTLDEGVGKDFDNAHYLSPAACKRAAMAYRNMLYTLKAKERRRSLRKSGKEFCAYDDLSGVVAETPTGWRITICKVKFDPAEFFDVKTGEVITQAQLAYVKDALKTEEEWTAEREARMGKQTNA